MTPTALDIVLPCYNPATGWAENIVRAHTAITQALPDTQVRILVVNDGSLRGVSTEDVQLLEKHIANFRYITYAKNRGKGYALREGIRHSDAPCTIYTDIDFPYTTESLLHIYRVLLRNEADMAIGVKNREYYAHVPPFRRFISRLLRTCSSAILRLKVSDTQCGLKGFNARGRELFLRTTIDRYLFDLEFIFLASRDAAIRMLPVEIALRDNVQFSSMRMSILLQESGNFFKIFIRSIFAR